MNTNNNLFNNANQNVTNKSKLAQKISRKFSSQFSSSEKDKLDDVEIITSNYEFQSPQSTG